MRSGGVVLVALLGCVNAHALRGQCPAPDTSAAWARVLRSWQSETGIHWSNDSLRQRLLAIEGEDQAARVEFGAHASDTAYLRRLMRGDSSRGVWLDSVMRRVGLPTKRLVGARGADVAMLIAQHNEWLLPRVLDLAKMAGAGQISPERLALMEDRVRVQRGERQLYGSQFKAMPDGTFAFEPVEDVAHLAERRAAAGLPPLVPDYVCMLEQAGMRVDHSSLPHVP